MATAILPPPPRETANPAPLRTANSVRRTSSLDVSWPDGEQGDRLIVGRVRDYLTPIGGGSGRVCAEAEMQAVLQEDKTITSISADPRPANLDSLVGQRGGGHLRVVLRDLMPELLEEGAPLYLALDDISGAALVSAFAWSQWYPDWAARLKANLTEEEYDRLMTDRADVCWGLQTGNSGLQPGAALEAIADAEAGSLRNPQDREGWHVFPQNEGAGFRRARRIDVRRDPGNAMLIVDSAFQDSAKRQDGSRVAIHEYRLQMNVHPDTLEILSLDPEPRILPFPECPGAVHNARNLIGSRIADIRYEVLANLRGPKGCTHLNDALRALAEVPKLASYLRD